MEDLFGKGFETKNYRVQLGSSLEMQKPKKAGCIWPLDGVQPSWFSPWSHLSDRHLQKIPGPEKGSFPGCGGRRKILGFKREVRFVC